MIEHLPEETCANHNCDTKLKNGTKCGGWTAQKQKNGNYITGYICIKCSQGSLPGTTKLNGQDVFS